MLRPVSPLILNSSIIGLKPGERRGVTDIGKLGLANPTENALLIDEIKFYVTQVGLSSVQPNARLNYQLALCLDLDIGRFKITQQPTPIGILGRPLDGGANVGQLSPNRGDFKTVTWRLPKPLYLAPEEYLDLAIYFNPAFLAQQPTFFPTSVNVDITVSCRVMPLGGAVPKQVPVPYVCGWSSQILNAGTDYLNITAPPMTFRNAYASPLYAKRFMGRFLYYSHGGGSLGNFTNVGDDTLAVRLSASDGRIVARDYIPWNFIFSPLDYSFNTNAVIPPKGFWALQARAKMRAATDALDQVQLFASMVGYHMIDLVNGVLSP